ncbi:hypothetical protein CsatB_019933 [Cannabis sativa]|uniref:Uncharacterized protein n=2 Tax=Cannabis sativa TaxID=3483 RepID=A0ABZ3NPI8_CANSA|nr:protein SOB FIVE-LIKE 1 [Cannabis sativa]KAF4402701.1 hypothetical protein G4B88_012486 [Cannabis sativa]
MESSSHLFGSSEKPTYDTESGWTMYIGSQIQHGVDDRLHENENKPYKGEDFNGESDDSMASDASSGPTLSELGVKERSQISGALRNRVNVLQHSKCSKLGKQEKKRIESRRNTKGEKELEKVRKAESASSQV